MTKRATAIYFAKQALSLQQMRGAMPEGLARVELNGETRFTFTHDGYTVVLRANGTIGGAVDATATKAANAPKPAPVEPEAAAIPATFDGLCKDMVQAIAGLDPEEVARAVAVKGSRLNLLKRAAVIYVKAIQSPAAARAGIIGVGLITYAQHRLARFAAHCNARRAIGV